MATDFRTCGCLCFTPIAEARGTHKGPEVDHGLTISDAEVEQIVQEALNFMDEQETQGNIVFNEIQL
jgi:hypothetical protein